MAARSVATLKALALRFIPPAWRGQAEAYAAAVATALQSAEAFAYSLLDNFTYAGATGTWLEYLGNAEGYYKADGEDDDTYRTRCQQVEDAVAPAAIRAALADIIPEGVDWQLSEHWQAMGYARVTGGTHYVADFYADGRTIMPMHNAFTVVIDAGEDDAVYNAVLAECDRLRAAGIRVVLQIETDQTYTLAATPWEAV